MKQKIIQIDGAAGEGGGQILRSTLSLSMCTGTPVHIANIRAGRRKSGLMRQHLACVRASQAISNATVKGAELGSGAIEFVPRAVRPGNYSFAIGSAGSTSLVFQTVLPALMMAKEVSTVSLSGGTHNGLAPSFDYIERCFVPALARMGVTLDTQLHAYGFAPVGGGSWQATIHPADHFSPMDMTRTAEHYEQRAVVTQCRVERSVAERELERVRKKLGWAPDELDIRDVRSEGPGNMISLRVFNREFVEMVEEVGSRGVKAERVVGRAIRDLKRFLASGAAVGEHLCDQLLLPMALGAGGRFTTPKLSLHTETNIQVIQQFLDCAITVTKLDDDLFEVVVSP